MNGDITFEALRRCQRASKVISPFIIFAAVFDVSFRRYKLYINYSFLHLYLTVAGFDSKNVLHGFLFVADSHQVKRRYSVISTVCL